MVINMRQLLICSCILSLLAISCDKDKLATRPSIKLKNKSADVIPVGEQNRLILEFDYADKEGDVGEGNMFVHRVRLNEVVVPTGTDTFNFKVPKMGTDRPDGQIEMRLSYNDHLKAALSPRPVPGEPPTVGEPDTLNFRFALTDREGNTSDTVTVGPFFVQRTR